MGVPRNDNAAVKAEKDERVRDRQISSVALRRSPEGSIPPVMPHRSIHRESSTGRRSGPFLRACRLYKDQQNDAIAGEMSMTSWRDSSPATSEADRKHCRRSVHQPAIRYIPEDYSPA